MFIYIYIICTRRMRVDTGVEEGSEISIHYDPMIAKALYIYIE
jgi:acetyl/propionyl-CoA carboxylase alpha subunit